MPSCYDRVSCSVDPDTGALTINTKHGSCTVVPGSTVTFTEDETGYIITIDGQPYLIPKIEPGDDVDFTETDDAYIITINNVPHSIPKCRYYRDCEGNILDECERIVTCDDLESRGFISCFDDNDFNITVEEVDGDLTRCLNIAWDRICAEAETVDEVPENANVLFCQGGEIKKGPLPEIDFDLTACIEADFPDLGDLCGEPKYLTVVGPDANGCSRFATYSPSGNSGNFQGLFSDARPDLPVDNTGYSLPADFIDPGNYYTWQDLLADDNLGTGTIDETKLGSSIITRVTMDLECRTKLEGTTFLFPENPAMIQDAYEQRMYVFERYRVDGGAWIYNRRAGDNQLQTGLPFNAVATEGLQRISNARFYGPGVVEHEVFYLGGNQGPPVVLNANTYTSGSGFVPFPRTRFTPAL